MNLLDQPMVTPQEGRAVRFLDVVVNKCGRPRGKTKTASEKLTAEVAQYFMQKARLKAERRARNVLKANLRHMIRSCEGVIERRKVRLIELRAQLAKLETP